MSVYVSIRKYAELRRLLEIYFILSETNDMHAYVRPILKICSLCFMIKNVSLMVNVINYAELRLSLKICRILSQTNNMLTLVLH